MMKKQWRRSLIVIFGFILVSGVLLKVSEVSNIVTNEDEKYINQILKENNVEKRGPGEYSEEIELIKRVQRAVLNTAPINKGLMENTPREPKVLVMAKHGLCYDRSRVIEKVLRFQGFETRHIYVFEKDTSNFLPFLSFFKSKNPSHAISEVKTAKGWIFVDSNDFFLGLDSENNPVSMEKLQNSGFSAIQWSNYNNMNYHVIYRKGFGYIYGLYSRHGKFYPPYNLIPDIYWEEMFENF